MIGWVAAIVALVALASVAVLVVVGPERIWRLVGPPDLGNVAFETLERRRTPNDALACPAGQCPADSDLVSPDYAATARELRQAFKRAMAGEKKLEQVAADDDRLQDRFVQRSRVLGFPDTIVVRFIDLPGGRSSLALYSRSQLGRSDLGANRARIERWLGRLAREVAPER